MIELRRTRGTRTIACGYRLLVALLIVAFGNGCSETVRVPSYAVNLEDRYAPCGYNCRAESQSPPEIAQCFVKKCKGTTTMNEGCERPAKVCAFVMKEETRISSAGGAGFFLGFVAVVVVLYLGLTTKPFTYGGGGN